MPINFQLCNQPHWLRDFVEKRSVENSDNISSLELHDRVKMNEITRVSAQMCWVSKYGGPYGSEVTRGQDLTGKDFSGKTLIKQDFKTVRTQAQVFRLQKQDWLIFQTTHSVLFLKSVKYGRMAEILVQRASSPDEFTHWRN
ncbi:hypothetical protein L6452_06481 [Arctium lappa]|uniref:Uncharacterized protein n=1 Tax=Arctium lappa TaxID=4217 RepID=A0ACB9EJY1_ARCLA|nr:hypothetical protein L6452_06481 [Arctium lappa]